MWDRNCSSTTNTCICYPLNFINALTHTHLSTRIKWKEANLRDHHISVLTMIEYLLMRGCPYKPRAHYTLISMLYSRWIDPIKLNVGCHYRWLSICMWGYQQIASQIVQGWLHQTWPWQVCLIDNTNSMRHFSFLHYLY